MNGLLFDKSACL